MADVFLSYSRKDADFVRRLDAALSDREREAWVDWEDIPPTAEWWSEVESGIEGSDALLFVISPGSAGSEICRRELAHALHHGKRVVPVVRDEVPPEALPPGLSHLNWIFFRPSDDFAESLGRLTTALDTDLERARTHTRLLTRAVEWEARGRDRNLVLRGSDLEEAERFMALGSLSPPRPTPLQGEYVAAGRGAATRRRRIIGAVGALMLAVAAVLTVVALLQRNEAIDQRRAAESRELSASALLTLAEDPELSLLLAGEAADVEPTDQALDALRQALVASHVRLRLPSGAESVGRAAFSADGSRAVTLADRGEGRVWDTRNGRLLARLRGHDGGGAAAEFSADGAHVLTAAQDGTIRVWDAATGRSLAEMRNERNGFFEHRIVGARFSPDGRSIVSWEFASGLARIWDWREERVVHDLEGHGGPGQSAAFSPDGRVVLTTGQDETARLWTTDDGRLRAVLEVPGEDEVVHAVLSPDGERVVAAQTDAAVYDAASGQRLRVFRGHSAPVKALAVSPDGALVATGGDDRTVRIWELGTGREVQVLRGHGDAVTGVAFRPDGDYLATSSRDGTARVWEVRTGNPVSVLRGHRAAVLGVEWHRSGSRILSWGTDGAARIWDAGIGEPVRRTELPDAPDGGFFISERGPGERRYASTGELDDVRLRIFDARTNRELRTVDLPFHPDAVAFAPSGDRLVVLGATGEALIGTVTGELRPLAVQGDPYTAAFDAAAERVVVTDDQSRATVFDAGSGERIAVFARHGGRDQEEAGFSGEVKPAFSPDGRTVVSADIYGKAWLWRPDTGEPIRGVEASSRWERMPGTDTPAFSADGRLVATTWNWEDVAHLWRVADGSRVTDLGGSSAIVFRAAFAPSGRLLVTSSIDGTLNVWDTDAGRSLLTLRAAGESLFSDVGFTAGGDAVVAYTGFADGVGVMTFPCDVCGSLDRLRELAEQRTTRGFTDFERSRYLHE